MAHTAQQVSHGQQLSLNRAWRGKTTQPQAPQRSEDVLLCAGCRAREARYGFHNDNSDPIDDRPRTLCFECFRIEIGRRQVVAARLARGWNAEQARLPLEETLRTLGHRRRRAQIAARHALGA